jgi:hypothetical protein
LAVPSFYLFACGVVFLIWFVTQHQRVNQWARRSDERRKIGKRAGLSICDFIA